MRKFLSIALLASLSVLCINDAAAQRRRVQANGNYITREVNGITEFDAIRSQGIADVEYTQSGGRPGVKVYGAENVLPYLIVKVNGNVLNISMKNNVNIQGKHGLKVIVSGPGLNNISTSGTGDIKIMGPLSAGDLEMTTTGTGDIEFGRIMSRGNVTMNMRGTGDIEGRSLQCRSLAARITGTGDLELDNIEVDAVELSVSGTGDAQLGGRTADFKVKVSGTGSVDAANLQADNVDASVSGTGSLSCHAVKSLYAKESGTGSIRYKGDPRTVDIRGSHRRVRRID